MSEERRAPVGASGVPEARVGRRAELTFVSGASTEHADGGLVGLDGGGIVLAVGARVGHRARPTFYPRGAGKVREEARAA